MTIRPLIIDDTTREKIAEIVEFAENNPFSLDDILDCQNGQMPPAGDMEGFSATIEVGYRIAYSIENQPAGKVRHLSVSVNEDGHLPSPAAVEQIMMLIGFDGALSHCEKWLEDITPTRKAINVCEFIN